MCACIYHIYWLSRAWKMYASKIVEFITSFRFEIECIIFTCAFPLNWWNTHPGYYCLLKGKTPPTISTLHFNDVIISEEVSAQPSPPPPASHLITAQVAATTLTQAQYNTIAALMCSLLCLPAGALVYDGHTHRPLSLHWHCAAEELRDGPCHSLGTIEMISAELRPELCRYLLHI